VHPRLVLTSGPAHPDPTAADDETSTMTTTTTYLVKAGDSLWSIAERQLGSPLRWGEIADLNYGRPQPDGGALTNAHWIYPGWELLLPASPEASVPVSGAEPSPEAVPVPVPPVEELSDDSPPQRTGPLMAGRSDQADHRTSADGERPETRGAGMAGMSEGRQSDHRASPAPLGPIGYGVLGAGVILLLERMRRAQRRHRSAGLRIALPDGDLVVLEQRLRNDADPDAVEIIDLGLRAMVTQARRHGMSPPRATVIRLTDHALEIALDGAALPGPPPPPFTPGSRATSWILAREPATITALRDDSDIAQMDAPFPALVTVGRDREGLVLVDLEQAASIDVTGPNGLSVLETIAVELATAPWADQVDLILVGFDRELGALDRVHYVPAIADVMAKVHRRVRERTALLASVGRHANWEIRWTEGGDSWDLCVVICGPEAVDGDRESAATLARLAGAGGLGLAVVLGSPTGSGRWNLSAVDGRTELTTTDATAATTTTTLHSTAVDGGLATGVAALIGVAGQLDGVLPTDPPYDKLQDRHVGQSPPEGDRSAGNPDRSTEGVEVADLVPPPPDDPEIEVRVLGPIDVLGAARPFTRAWAIELIVYLAMHPNGASSEQWATALWPDRIMAAASLHSTASAARRSLGVSASGEDHLPRAHGRLSLSDSVGSDWSRFVELSERPDPRCWGQALELIRGRPFEGLRAPDWVLLEGIAANVEASVVDLANRYAVHCLSVGDPSGAEWSARQGLRVSPYDERLYRTLLRAADAAGNPAGVESVMAELIRLVAEDVEPYDAVHPETLDLYRSLSRRTAPFASR
jgi:DNA-binding SARP family transcriptional activator